MEGSIQRVEMTGANYNYGITLNGDTPFGIVWEEERTIYLFDNSPSADMAKQHQ